MPDGTPEVTLVTVHDDLIVGFGDLKGEVRAGFADLKDEMRTGFADLKDEMRTGFADLKGTLVAGFRSLPSRESSEEMVRLLRESNRLNEERFTQLDVKIREQHLETQQVLHALVEGQRALVDGQHLLVDGQRTLSAEVRGMAADIKALIARIDALIRGRNNGERGT
jgi:hypothetical protein